MINLDNQFSTIIEKYNKIESSLNTSSKTTTEELVILNREYAELKPIVEKMRSPVRRLNLIIFFIF